MTHNPEGCFYSAISRFNNSLHHLTDYRVGHEYREEKPDDQDMQWMFGDQNYGDFSRIEYDTLCCLTLPAQYIMHCVVSVSDL
jgi:hypothetical protein